MCKWDSRLQKQLKYWYNNHRLGIRHPKNSIARSVPAMGMAKAYCIQKKGKHTVRVHRVQGMGMVGMREGGDTRHLRVDGGDVHMELS